MSIKASPDTAEEGGHAVPGQGGGKAAPISEGRSLDIRVDYHGISKAQIEKVNEISFIRSRSAHGTRFPETQPLNFVALHRLVTRATAAAFIRGRHHFLQLGPREIDWDTGFAPLRRCSISNHNGTSTRHMTGGGQQNKVGSTRGNFIFQADPATYVKTAVESQPK